VRTKLAVIIFLLSVTPALGQTVSDIELKYGNPHLCIRLASTFG
jgi:hypothetical protein